MWGPRARSASRVGGAAHTEPEAVPDGFFDTCIEDPARIEELIAAECPPELAKSDGWLGWKGYGERCWFNWECDDGMECRPLDYPSLSRNEDIFTNGMCVSHDKQVDSQGMCAVDFY